MIRISPPSTRAAARGAALMAVALVGLAAVSTAGAQRSPSSGWQFCAEPQVDLWFHGLAVVGYEGFAALPMYSSDYARRVRAAKGAAGVYPGPLDTLARSLRVGLGRDSVFEVLHFLPLYFVSVDPAAMRRPQLTSQSESWLIA